MGILDTFLNRRRENIAALQYRSSAGGLVPAWQAGKAQWLPQTVDSQDTHGYRKIALIAACVEYLSHAAGTAPLRVFDPESEEADDTHPLRQLIVRPNRGMGEGRFFSFITMNMAVTNFVVIEKERDNFGTPIALWPLRSDWIRPILRNQAEPDWEYRVPGRDPIILKADDVIVIPWADTPDQSPIGMGPLTTVLREAKISSSLTDFVNVFMERGGVPLYAIIPQDEGPGAAQWKKPETKNAFLEAWRQRYQGLNNHADPLPMVGVKDVKRIGLDMNELAYTDLNAMADARICTAFGVPAVLVGAEVGLQHSTYSNGEQAERNFYSGTMPRLWARIDDAFTRQLLPEFEWRPGWDIRFDTSEIAALQDDVNEAWTRATSAWTAGLISRHVAHEEMGVDPHGVDEFLIPFNMVPTPITGAPAVAPGKTDATVDVESEGERMYREFLRHLNIYALPTHDPKATRYVVRDGRRYLNEYRLSPDEREARSLRIAGTRQIIIGLANVIEPRLASYFTEQAERVVEGLNLRTGDAPIERRFAEAIDWGSEDDLLRQIFGAWWEEVTGQALTSAEALLGVEINWAVANPYLQDIAGLLGQRITGINEATRDALESRITAMLGEGTTIPDLANAVQELVTETYQGRATTIARTESMLAYGTASTDAYAASGVVQYAELHDNPGHTTDPGSDGLTCSERNNLVVPLTQVSRHLQAEHPNGTLAVSPIVTPLADV
jgi:HK97 family phage portal protein